jgi:hypothetical protein
VRSVADDLRGGLAERVRAWTPDERVALTARLAGEDLDLFATARQLPRDVAREMLRRQRQVGRRPGRVMECAS